MITLHLADLEHIGFNVADAYCGKHVEGKPRVMLANEHAFTYVAMFKTRKICSECEKVYRARAVFQRERSK